MKFYIVLAALVAAVSAAPAPVNASPDAAQLCIHIRDCVEALAPALKACATAAADRGRSLTEDAECLKEALDASLTVPDACKSCMPE